MPRGLDQEPSWSRPAALPSRPLAWGEQARRERFERFHLGSILAVRLFPGCTDWKLCRHLVS